MTHDRIVERIDCNCHEWRTSHLHDMEPWRNISSLAEFHSKKTFVALATDELTFLLTVPNADLCWVLDSI